MSETTGHASVVVPTPGDRVRVARYLWLQNVDAEHVVMLMIGRKAGHPKLAVPLSAMEARQVAAALEEHARRLDEAGLGCIILPGPRPHGATDG